VLWTVAAWVARVWLGLCVLLWLSLIRASFRRAEDVDWVLDPARPPEGELAQDVVTIIVPARDEVEVIEASVRAALAQDHTPQCRVVVLDDGSTDGTGEILARLMGETDRLEVIDGGGGPLPDGWMGKPWACQRAAEAALQLTPRPDRLLFVDADVVLHPAALRLALVHARAHELDLLSGYGDLELVSFWEKVVQPAVVTLLLLGRPLSVVNDNEREDRPPMANGQFMLFRTAAWEALGGHRAVQGDVLDDVGMARAVIGAGQRSGVVLMPALFSTRMYTSLSEIWDGWTKNLFAGLEHRWDRLLGTLFFVLFFTVLPWLLPLLWLAGLLGVEWALWGGICAGLMLALRLRVDGLSGHDRRFAPTWPLGFSVLLALLVGSAVRTTRGTAVWKGRAIPRAGGPS
jgi:glycosyltransferase involved in cell wall biosynthesis